MKKTNKLLAILPCLAMFISLLPTWALAEEELPAEAPAAELIQESVQEEPEAELPEQTTEPEVLAEEAPIYEEAVIEEPVEEVLPEPSEEVSPEETPDAEQSVTAEEPAVLPGTESADAEAEAAPTDVVVTEAVAEPEAQESAEETEAVPVKIVFAVTPENAELIIYTKDEYEAKSVIDPGEDGSYLLFPGEYFYALTAEGYVGVEEETFTVEPSEEPIEVELTLVPVQPEEGAENTEEATAEAAKEETATLMATSGTCGANLTWTLDDEGTLTISGSGTMDGTKDEYLENPPWEKTKIKKLVIESGVTDVGSYAFSDCENLEQIEIGNSVKTIGNYAFSGCSALKELNIPGNVVHIGNEAFVSCSKIINLVISEGVKTLGQRTFGYCSSLMTVKLPGSLTEVGHEAFNQGGFEGGFETSGHVQEVYYGGTEQRAKEIFNYSQYGLQGAIWHYATSDDEGWELCGSSLLWQYDSNTRILHIKGAGPMWNWKDPDYYTGAPWYEYAGKITNISAGGCCIQTTLPIKEKQYIGVSLPDTGIDEVMVGIIRRTRRLPTGKLALHIQFVQISLFAKNRINTLVYKYEL